MTSRTILVTGAGRGIGLFVARAALARGDRLIASLRDPTQAPDDIRAASESGRARLIGFDVRNEAAILGSAALVDEPIDILLNNAGIIGPLARDVLSTPIDGFLDTFDVNVLGPLRVSRAFLPHLRQAARASGKAGIVTISSRMGTSASTATDRIAYRTSKAAVNKLMHALASDLLAEGIICASIHPGWVRTDMGGPAADVDVRDSAAAILGFLDALSPDQAGRVFDVLSGPLPF